MTSDASEVNSVDRDEFLKELRGDPKNKRYKAGCINEFLRFLHRRSGLRGDPRRVTRRELEAYGAHVSTQPIAASTKATKMRLVIAWYRWMEQTGRIEQNPASGTTPSGLLPEQ